MNEDLEELSKRIKELGDKATQLLLFLSFAMVSVATLKSSQGINASWYPLDTAFFWWKLALLPTLFCVVPLKEISRKNEKAYSNIIKVKLVFLYLAILLIIIGVGYFIAAQ